MAFISLHMSKDNEEGVKGGVSQLVDCFQDTSFLASFPGSPVCEWSDEELDGSLAIGLQHSHTRQHTAVQYWSENDLGWCGFEGMWHPSNKLYPATSTPLYYVAAMYHKVWDQEICWRKWRKDLCPQTETLQRITPMRGATVILPLWDKWHQYTNSRHMGDGAWP